MGVREVSIRVGVKQFSLTFEGGQVAPYHIIERRGKFVSSLWLGMASLKWVFLTWSTLCKSSDLKGFLIFLRTNYNTLELSCLQNQYGRFVELLEYHGGVQRGGIRVLEGYRGTGWKRFAKRIESFFFWERKCRRRAWLETTVTS